MKCQSECDTYGDSEMRKDFMAGLVCIGLSVPIGANALTRYTCQGEIGNGATPSSSAYKFYGNKTVDMGIECSLYQRYIGANCSGYLEDGISKFGYFIGDEWTFSGVMGMFNETTGYLFYQKKDGAVGSNQNRSQRWFYGWCSKI